MGVTHGGGGIVPILRFALSTQLKSRWPLMLGGTPRHGLLHSGNIDQESLQKLADLVRTGQVKGMVDSVWEMDDVKEVSVN